MSKFSLHISTSSFSYSSFAPSYCHSSCFSSYYSYFYSFLLLSLPLLFLIMFPVYFSALILLLFYSPFLFMFTLCHVTKTRGVAVVVLPGWSVWSGRREDRQEGGGRARQGKASGRLAGACSVTKLRLSVPKMLCWPLGTMTPHYSRVRAS